MVSSKSSSWEAAGLPFIATDRVTTPEVAGAKAFAEATRARSERASFILMSMLLLQLVEWSSSEMVVVALVRGDGGENNMQLSFLLVCDVCRISYILVRIGSMTLKVPDFVGI